jgi:hypothetical protein
MQGNLFSLVRQPYKGENHSSSEISVTSPNQPTNAHIPHTRPMHASLIRTSTQEWGNIYIYSYIKNINIFASHKSSHKHKIHHRANTNIVTIMIGSSYDSNLWSTRESLIKVNSISHSLGGELLPLHHVAEGDGVDGVEGATRCGSGSVSPPILVVSRSILCIMCFSAAQKRNDPRGPLYSRF